MDAPNDEGIQRQIKFLRWMCQYFVGLVAKAARYDEDGKCVETTILSYSGFVIRMHGMHFFVTAGHCIQELEELMQASPTYQVWGLGLMDSFGSGAVHEEALPFPYEVGDAWWIHDEDDKLDFAIVKLPDFVWRGLQSNGVLPVVRSMWQERPEREYFECKIIGLPGHLRQEPEGGQGWMVRVVGVGLERLRPEDVLDQPGEGWFIGLVRPPPNEIISIRGMSGGPIFGFYKNEQGQNCYDIIALQSWWVKGKRIAFGCPMASFAEDLYAMLEELKIGADQ